MCVGSVSPFTLAAGTGDIDPDTAGFEPLQGPLFWAGFSIRESAAVGAAATIIFRDGRTDTAKIVGVLELAANESETIVFPKPIRLSSGLFIERAAGETEGAVFVG